MRSFKHRRSASMEHWKSACSHVVPTCDPNEGLEPVMDPLDDGRRRGKCVEASEGCW